jgi:hypothetical protein
VLIELCQENPSAIDQTKKEWYLLAIDQWSIIKLPILFAVLENK